MLKKEYISALVLHFNLKFIYCSKFLDGENIGIKEQ